MSFFLKQTNKQTKQQIQTKQDSTLVSSPVERLSSFFLLLFNTESGFGPPTRLRFRRGFSSVVESLSFSSVSFSCLEG